jgi:hypothetical protein
MADTAIEIHPETDPTYVGQPDPASQDAHAPEEQEPERPSRAEERIGELAGTVEGLRSITQAQAAQLAALRQGTGQPGFKPRPDYESHDFMQYLDQRYGPVMQQMQAVNQGLMVQNDHLNARLNIDDTFGPGTFKKYGKQVEDAFQAEMAKGTPEPREKIFYRLATERGWKLTPQEERDAAETNRSRKRSASSASVSNSPPARRADAPAPEKPMSAMTKQERDAAFQSYIDRNGGY